LKTDEELMAAYVRGDGVAFKELFGRYAPKLERLMLRELFAREEAHDLVQQTFLQLHRARLDFDPEQRFKPWIYTIAMNLKREHFRRRRRRPRCSVTSPRSRLQGTHTNAFEAHRSLAWALARLPDDSRSVIELHWFDGLSFAEVANASASERSPPRSRPSRLPAVEEAPRRGPRKTRSGAEQGTTGR
jgi:RNA polymerase sigma-70 factor (ECF subfamily)